MKKIICLLVLFFVLSLFVLSSASAYDSSDTGWKIMDYSVDAKIENNQKVQITENITVDFGELQKHGIFRYIPYKYSRSGNNYNVRINIKTQITIKGSCSAVHILYYRQPQMSF